MELACSGTSDTGVSRLIKGDELWERVVGAEGRGLLPS